MFGRTARIISALDIGSETTRAAIAQIVDRDVELVDEEMSTAQLKIIGVGEVRTMGVERGEFVDISKVADSIRAATEQASVMASTGVKDVVVSLNGRHARTVDSVGTISLSGSSWSKDTCAMRAIVESDLHHAIEDAKSVTVHSDERMLHTIVQDFAVDGRKFIKNPIGKTGQRLDAHVKVILVSQSALNDLERALGEAHLSPRLIMLESLASARACLTPEQMEDGVLLIDIGKGTTDAIIYFGGSPRYVSCVAMAGGFVTRDVAHSLGCDMRSAEEIKLSTGRTATGPRPAEGRLESLVSEVEEATADPRALRAISSRNAEILLTLRNDIRRADAEQFIRREVVLTGRASQDPGLCGLASSIFGVQAQTGKCANTESFDGALHDPGFTSVMGLLSFGHERAAGVSSFSGQGRSFFSRAWNALTCKNVSLT
ncbi:MAG: cell division protein FtsA [Candidatus Coatesbacteria bacterium]|nr:MAG: cell division protein FtsA [Candidatus Coatesbacteria bacterium]HDM58904.1 cell division protein FtsA [Bacillota bacterium]